ncbi:hypothetical protein CAPTEDRAFT_207773 [Capitella teleta]|uniref:Uncharacterized protein n=1 Tax=Capitella teleta TaxID=283909 RepID=R7U358_CAPTE|nr:hypothetical protein CAPTEDRAFT_207773 [Capitella teleta]|eukprot:ELT98111.1 hypothetical protein CAPTEDRAFT_207773 [Capitella teleta]
MSRRTIVRRTYLNLATRKCGWFHLVTNDQSAFMIIQHRFLQFQPLFPIFSIIDNEKSKMEAPCWPDTSGSAADHQPCSAEEGSVRTKEDPLHQSFRAYGTVLERREGKGKEEEREGKPLFCTETPTKRLRFTLIVRRCGRRTVVMASRPVRLPTD